MKATSLQPKDYLNKIIAETPIKPAEFCRRWLDIDKIEYGDRQHCDRAISKILKVKPTTVRDWGDAPAYPRMPKTHQMILTLCHKCLLERYL